MENGLKKKYGLPVAIAMVVGIVVGSGVFFKAEKILGFTGGNLKLGILSWLIGGVIMIICSYTFAIMATKHEKVNGIVDYAEATLGGKYAYYLGWFFTMIYYPCITMVLAWVSARYTLVAIYGTEADITGGLCLVLAGFYLIASYAVNALSPIIAGKFQVSTTVIKLIPLMLMAFVGTIYGLTKGYTVENFTTVVNEVSTFDAVLPAVCATAFAYEGWIIATSINAELKDAKKNLPKALVLGSIIIVVVYILYYVGLAGAIPNAQMMANGETGAKSAFSAVFGNIAGTGLFIFVIISCLGTLNGLMLGCTRGMYAISSRKVGPKPEIFSQVDSKTNMPTNSSILGLLLCAVWLLFFYCAQLSAIGGKMGVFAFDPSELPIITVYMLYIPIFIMMMKQNKEFSIFKRFIVPALAIIGSLFMMYAGYRAHKATLLGYLCVFAVIMIAAVPFSKAKQPIVHHSKKKKK